MSELLQVNDSSFEDEIVKSNIPAMVDLWAPWCQPCLMTAPWVEELAQKYEGSFQNDLVKQYAQTVSERRKGSVMESLNTLSTFLSTDLNVSPFFNFILPSVVTSLCSTLLTPR